MKKTLFLILSLVFLFPVFAFSASFEIDVDKLGFYPGLITVKRGERVVIKFTSKDVTHGIHFDKFGAPNITIPELKSVTIEFTPNETGRFHFKCTKFCSWRHLVGAMPAMDVIVE
ncbi:MAG: cupredoxin domain-containing protein [Deltaproteobacteria bacterium]